MIKVLIIDDSALVRESLKNILNSAAGIQVIDTAADPYFARDKIKKLNPDVITLDIEMPRMDGLTFLKKLMAYRPIPVIMVSSLTERGASITLEALRAGAVDFVTKPTSHVGDGLVEMSDEIVSKVRSAAQAKLRKKSAAPTFAAEPRVEQKVLIDQVLAATPLKTPRGDTPVVCIGASTGGTVAIEDILLKLPGNTTGIVVVQHMPGGYTKMFADRLDAICEMEIVEAESGMAVCPGRAIIAKGGYHLLLQRSGKGYYVDVKDGPPVNRHKPSVDVLFRSAANAAGENVLGLILTGMGDDGARGMVDLASVGAYTVAQDESSSVVFGMPHTAIERGGVSRILGLKEMPGIILAHMKRFT